MTWRPASSSTWIPSRFRSRAHWPLRTLLGTKMTTRSIVLGLYQGVDREPGEQGLARTRSGGKGRGQLCAQSGQDLGQGQALPFARCEIVEAFIRGDRDDRAGTVLGRCRCRSGRRWPIRRGGACGSCPGAARRRARRSGRPGCRGRCGDRLRRTGAAGPSRRCRCNSHQYSKRLSGIRSIFFRCVLRQRTARRTRCSRLRPDWRAATRSKLAWAASARASAR